MHIHDVLGPTAEDTTVLILPADHHVEAPEDFRRCLRAACQAAEATGAIVTLGIEATRPETGYGYIERGEGASEAEDGDGPPVYPALRFVEKPDRETAQAYLQSGRFLWNAGIFVTRLTRLEREYVQHEPELWNSLRAARSADDPDALARAYVALPSSPIDIDIMERQSDMRVVPTSVGWSDLGSWQSIADLFRGDDRGNVVLGEHGSTVALDSRDCLIWNEGGTVAAIGLEGVAIIQSQGRTLVCPIDRAQEVRAALAELATRDTDEGG
jgi:mannose-1-phosphate guanylyltransferase